DRRRGQVVIRIDRIRWWELRGRRRRSIDAELRQVDLVNGCRALLGTADADVAAGASVHLSPGSVTLAWPDELLADDGPPAGSAMRGVQLLDVLTQGNVDPARRGQRVERRVEGSCLGCQQEGLSGELREGAGIGGDRPHAVGDRAARGPTGARPGVQDGIARRGERCQLSVEQVVGWGREVALEERQTGEATRKDDMVQAL